MIILVHSAQKFDSLSNLIAYPSKYGQMGCQLFFIISSLTICISWVNNYEDDYKKNKFAAAWKFLKHRFSVIAPGVYTVIFFWVVFNLVKWKFLGSDIYDNYAAGIIINILFLNGIFPQFNNWVYPGAWYIGTTMIFYFVFPLSFNALKRFNICGEEHYKRNTYKLCLLYATYTVVWYLLINILYTCILGEELTGGFVYYSLLNQMPVLLCGIIAYDIWREDKFTDVRHTFAGMMCFLALDVFVFYCPMIPNRFALVPAISGAAFLFLLILIEKNYRRIPERIKHIFTKLGEKSFYVFLAHTLFAWWMPMLAQRLLDHFRLFISDNALYIILIIPIFWLSYIAGCCLSRVVDLERKIINGIVKP